MVKLLLGPILFLVFKWKRPLYSENKRSIFIRHHALQRKLSVVIYPQKRIKNLIHLFLLLLICLPFFLFLFLSFICFYSTWFPSFIQSMQSEKFHKVEKQIKSLCWLRTLSGYSHSFPFLIHPSLPSDALRHGVSFRCFLFYALECIIHSSA